MGFAHFGEVLTHLIFKRSNKTTSIEGLQINKHPFVFFSEFFVLSVVLVDCFLEFFDFFFLFFVLSFELVEFFFEFADYNPNISFISRFRLRERGEIVVELEVGAEWS